jgi:hypothetical protein
MTVFGATTLWTGAYSRRVGGFLLLAALGLLFVIVKALLFGDVGGPEWVSYQPLRGWLVGGLPHFVLPHESPTLAPF